MTLYNLPDQTGPDWTGPSIYLFICLSDGEAGASITKTNKLLHYYYALITQQQQQHLSLVLS